MNRIITLIFSVLISVTAFGQVGLKINEVDYDQLSLDSAEYLEIYNSDLSAVDLGNYTILLINGNNNTPYDTIALPTFSLSAGDYYVICGNGGYVPNCDLQLPVNANIIQNGAPDAIAIIENSTGNIIDALSYEGSVAAPYVEGTGAPAGQSDTLVSSPLLSMGRFPDGTDSNDNSADFHTQCATPGIANLNGTSTCVSAVSTVSNLNSIRVFPNPSRGISLIDCRGLKSPVITVSNVLGKEIKSYHLNDHDLTVQCDLTEEPNGVYFVKIKAESVEITQRIILRK